MKILLAQLPLLDHARGYLHGNIEYGPAAMTAFIKKNFGSEFPVFMLPSIISSFGSDSLIVRYIKSERPDMVGFTCCLWNVERTLRIAALLKESLPGLAVVLGGPEIEPGSAALSERRPQADWSVSGEGEWFFRLFLSGKDLGPYSSELNGNRLVVQPGGMLLQPDDIAEPFTSGFLNTGLDGTAYLELMRGCPNRCTYCFYSKRSHATRELPFRTLTGALSGRRGIREIYILSPAFSASIGFREKLAVLADLNPGIALHTEMRAAGITGETARLMHRAGFRSLEVGLQTMNRDALRLAGRTGDPEEELSGMATLKEAGIGLKIGIIPGLPGDTPMSFMNTIDTLVRRGFGDDIELYPLMVLPGTAIRDLAEKQGIAFQKRPPYYFLGSDAFTLDDIKGIVSYAEEKTGSTHSLMALPDFVAGEGRGYAKGVSFNGDEPENWNPGPYTSLVETNVFSFFIHMTRADPLYAGLSFLLSGLPESELFNLVFFCDLILDEERIRRSLVKADEDSFCRRLNLFGAWAEGLRFRLFQVFADLTRFRRADETYGIVEPVFGVTKSGACELERSGMSGISLLIRAGSLRFCREYLAAHYSEDPDLVAFETEEEQEEFYRMIGCGYLHIPYSFRIESR